jgi:hypothetical protein
MSRGNKPVALLLPTTRQFRHKRPALAREAYSVGNAAALDGRPHPTLVTIRPMARYTFPAFNTATTPRYVVLWDLQWRVLKCQRLEPAAAGRTGGGHLGYPDWNDPTAYSIHLRSRGKYSIRLSVRRGTPSDRKRPG